MVTNLSVFLLFFLQIPLLIKGGVRMNETTVALYMRLSREDDKAIENGLVKDESHRTYSPFFLRTARDDFILSEIS